MVRPRHDALRHRRYFPSSIHACRQPAAPAFDLMRVPLVGRFLRWRLARPAMQLLMMMLAAVVIFDGLNGPQVSPMNLAGIAAVDSLARLADLEPVSGRQCVLHGVSHLRCRVRLRAAGFSKDDRGRDGCGASGWQPAWWQHFCGAMKRSLCGTAPGYGLDCHWLLRGGLRR